MTRLIIGVLAGVFAGVVAMQCCLGPSLARGDWIGMAPVQQTNTRGAGDAIPPPLAYGLGAASFLLLASLVFSRRRRDGRSRSAVARGGVSTTLSEVRSPSANGETAGVVRLAGAIVCGALFVIALDSRGTPDAARPAPGALAPFQVRFQDLSPSVQRVVGELLAGVHEAERVRAATRAWPSAASLAAQGISPFASRANEQDGYAWISRVDGGCVNYRGVPAAGSRAPTYLVLIEERGAGEASLTAPDGTPLGEPQQLTDGTRVHVSSWLHPVGVTPVDDAVVTHPVTDGWIEIVAGAPARGDSQ